MHSFNKNRAPRRADRSFSVAESGTSPRTAVFARCYRFAAFNVALTAWKLAGYQVLPPLHLACSGHAPSATEAEWAALAGNDDRLRHGMMRLHGLFKDAPVLGSLINPRAQGGSLVEASFQELAPLLISALEANTRQHAKLDDDAAEFGVIAHGLAKAAELLAAKYTLVITNVPYLGRLKQHDVLRQYCEEEYPDSKADLATCFIERCLRFCTIKAGSSALVTPQLWFFLTTFKNLRRKLLKGTEWRAVASLGEEAWWTFGMRGPRTVLTILSATTPHYENVFFAIDVSTNRGMTPIMLEEKASLLSVCDQRQILAVDQLKQLDNPDSCVVFEPGEQSSLLSRYADSFQGAATLDIEQFRLMFFEVRERVGWQYHQSSPAGGKMFSGAHYISADREPGGRFFRTAELLEMEKRAGAPLAGKKVWGKQGVACAWMGYLPTSMYLGAVFDNSIAAIVPRDPRHLPAIWCFCSSKVFVAEVRKINQKNQVANATLVKVPFDLVHWQNVAAKEFPNGLPTPQSSDPTQWLFNGHPKGSDQSLHVAVARFLGYKWPRQTGSSFHDCPAIGPDGLEAFADPDGIVCLPPVNREQPAATRLRHLLAAALGTLDERSLIAAAGLKGSKSKTLEDWLRDEFFEQHAKLFHDRPFIWHLWDGRSDGFHALVNYHKLDHATLQKLVYSYLGNWIQQQDIDAKADKPGAAERLGAARALQAKLAAILEGEAPLDIFVRWKPIKDQAQGWNPDLNDGIRQNIRPFLLAGDVGKRDAGLFRAIPLKLKDSDRGNEPNRLKEEYPWFWCDDEPGTDPAGGKEFVGTRWNNVHLTLEKKKGSKA